MGILAELRRRNVIRVAMAYLVLGWLLLQVGDVLFGLLELPGWSLRLLAALLALGFIPTVIFAWAFELTPEGIKREADVDRDSSITPATGRKLDFAIVGLLALSIGLFLTEDLWRSTGSAPASQAAEGMTEPAPAVEAPARTDNYSVAVLPFENMSPDPDNAFFAEGISEEILNLLAAVDALSVASRTSAFVYRDRDTPIPEIAAALDVRYVLEGSVRKAGNQVRITAQLIDAGSDRHLWSDTFDRNLDDIFAVQDEIAGAIGTALEIELLGRGGSEVAAESVDPAVYTDYLRARHLLRQRTGPSIHEGNALLLQVVEAAPDFARGHAVLAEAYLLNRNLALPDSRPLVSPEVAAAQAKIHAGLAQALDPTLGGADLILGALAEEEPDLVAAMEHYARAIELEPNEPRPYHWRGMLLTIAGYPEDAARDLRRARELDPENPNINFALADALGILGDLEGVERAARLGDELSGMKIGLTFLVQNALKRGDRDRALAVLRELPATVFGPVNREFWVQLEAHLESGESMDASIENQTMNCSWITLIDAEARLAWMDQQPYDTSNTFGCVWAEQGAAIRKDPRFIAFLNRYGIPDLWRHRGPPEDCRPEGESFRCGLSFDF
ncbi:MAG: hypothetical protein AAGE01_13785 [Pseudomonadota bacterium]